MSDDAVEPNATQRRERATQIVNDPMYRLYGEAIKSLYPRLHLVLVPALAHLAAKLPRHHHPAQQLAGAVGSPVFSKTVEISWRITSSPIRSILEGSHRVVQPQADAAMSSLPATPSCSRKVASLRNGAMSRFTTKPAESAMTTGFLPMASDALTTASTDSSLVW